MQAVSPINCPLTSLLFISDECNSILAPIRHNKRDMKGSDDPRISQLKKGIAKHRFAYGLVLGGISDVTS